MELTLDHLGYDKALAWGQHVKQKELSLKVSTGAWTVDVKTPGPQQNY